MKRIVSAALAASLLAGTALAQPPERGDRGGRGGDGARAERQQDRGDRGQRQGGGRNFGDRGGDNGGGFNRGDGGGGQAKQRQEQAQQAAPQQPVQRQPQVQQPQPQVQAQQGPQPGRGSYLRSPADRRGEFQGGPIGRQDDNRDRRTDNRGFQNDNRGFQNDNRGFQGGRPGQNFGYGQNYGYGQNLGNNRGGQQQFRDRDRGRQQYDQRRYRPSYNSNQRFRIGQYRTPQGFFFRSWNFGDRLPYGWYSPSYYLSWGSYGLPLPPIGCEWVRVGDDALLVDVWSGEVLSVYYGLFW